MNALPQYWCTIVMASGFILFGALAESAWAAPRATKAPLDIVSVAKSPSPPRKPAKKGGRKTDARLPQAAVGAAAIAGAAIAKSATVATPDPNDVTGAVGSKRAGKAAKPSPQQPGASATDGTQFCSNVVDVASDARLAWQMKELEKVEASLRTRIAELEAKRAEYEKWLKLRQDFLKKAEDNVVSIYSRMRPDAAAAQIASMQDDTAAAVLAKLNARNSSAILNEMEPARAAHLANTLSGLRQTDNDKSAK
jgi:flagellar motility protein MotE (MotC chaperone)